MNKTWSIGEIANLFDISPETLRYYEKAGIISVAKNKINGYRNYTYEDLVILMDILFFRNLDVSLKDIDEIIKTKNLEEITTILKAKQQLLARKLNEIQQQQEILSQVVAQYENSIEHLGQFKLVSTPNFSFKIMGRDDNDLFTIINNLKKIEKKPMHIIDYLLLIPEKDLQQNANFKSTHFGILVNNANHKLIDSLKSLGLTLMEEGEYLHTILSTNYSVDANATLIEAKTWLNNNHYHIAGPLYGHYIASCHSKQLDFYEIWIKAKKNI